MTHKGTFIRIRGCIRCEAVRVHCRNMLECYYFLRGSVVVIGGSLPVPVLMFMNMKGGVGKTTLAVEISRTLGYTYDKDVLLIDYDPQANASFAFFESPLYFDLLEKGKSISDCLMPRSDQDDPFNVVRTAPPNEIDVGAYSVNVRNWYYRHDWSKKAGRLDIIPGNLELMRLALNVVQGETENSVLARWNGLIGSAKNSYDCVVIDCHPAGSFFTKSALLSSDAVIVPVTSDAYAGTGLSLMRRHMEMWQSSGGAKEFLVVFNEAQKGWDESVEVLIRGNDRFSSHCLSNRIRYSALLRNLAKRHHTSVEQPVANRRRVGANIEAVTSEMVSQLKGKGIFDSSWG